MIISWFSGGCTSAVACKIAIETYGKDNVHLVYIETGSHHEDHPRFLADCERWYDKKIEAIRSTKYSSVIDAVTKIKFLNSPYGASCTRVLKKAVRVAYEIQHPEITHQVWGFEFNQKEMNRASRIKDTIPQYEHLFPLIERKITKEGALLLLEEAVIEFPAMYRLGYTNSNCLGCIKGGKAYWNKIRIDFPEIFAEMAAVERAQNHTCLKDVFLDELDPSAGRGKKPLVMDCGSVGEGCEITLLREYSSRE